MLLEKLFPILLAQSISQLTLLPNPLLENLGNYSLTLFRCFHIQVSPQFHSAVLTIWNVLRSLIFTIFPCVFSNSDYFANVCYHPIHPSHCYQFFNFYRLLHCFHLCNRPHVNQWRKSYILKIEHELIYVIFFLTFAIFFFFFLC